MKISFMMSAFLATMFLSTTAPVLGFVAPVQQLQRESYSLNMAAAMIYPFRKVPVPPTVAEAEAKTGPFPWSKKLKDGDVMVEPDYFLPKDIAAMAPGLLVMYHPAIFPGKECRSKQAKN
jgi:hypothetical protein